MNQTKIGFDFKNWNSNQLFKKEMDMEANSWFHLGLLRIDCKYVDSSIHIKVRW